jgi:hypothetical protein
MGLRGSVKAFSLDQLFEFLSASGHLGTLRVTHKSSNQKTIYLWHGGVYVERSEWSYRLGDVLIRFGHISRPQLDEALQKQKDSPDKRLGDVLLALGYTTNELILIARRKQVEEEIFDLFSWEDAFFEFEKDVVPEGFEKRLEDPEEFRFDVRAILMEATRRLDEWKRIHEHVPSLKRLYMPEDKDRDASTKRVMKAFKEMKVNADLNVFDGRRAVEELARTFGLSHFETLSLLARFVANGDIRPLARHELEARFRVAVEEDLPYAIKLFECSLETPEFEARGKYLDRALFGSAAFRNLILVREAKQGDTRPGTNGPSDQLPFSARVRGKRALELLLGLFRQGIPCDLQATEEGRTLRLSFSKSALIWRGAEGLAPPNVVKHLLARSPIPAADMARVEEMQKQTGRTLQQILVGGGYVTMDNWFRAQKDTVLNEVFDIFFWKKPYIEVKCGEAPKAQRPKPGLDIDVPMLPWLREEVTEEVRRWESVVSAIPSVRAFFHVTAKGKNSLKPSGFDPLLLFEGVAKPLEEVMKAQAKPPQEFFSWLYEQITAGRVEALSDEDYRICLEEELAAGRRKEAIRYCIAALDSGLQARHYQDRLKELEAAELEVETQATRPTLRGDLASFSLAEVLQSFYMSKRSGTLRIIDGAKGREREIYFQDGEVYLLLEGYDSGDEELQPLHLGSDDHAETLALQMKDELYEVFLWDAEFEFAANVLPHAFYNEVGQSYRVKINTQQFLMEAVRRIAEWEEVRATLPTDDLVVTFENYEQKMHAITARGYPDLLLLVDGRHRIADAIRMSGVGRFQALVLLADLTRSGDVVIVTDEKMAEKEAEHAGRSGMIDAGFIGALRAIANENATGLVRATDGRRSKEVAIIEGALHRTGPYRGDSTHPDASLLDAARDLAECTTWPMARWELMDGTLPPLLEKADSPARAPYKLTNEDFFSLFVQAVEEWRRLIEEVPKDKHLAIVDEEQAREKAAAIAGSQAKILLQLDGTRTADDIARAAGHARFETLSTIHQLIKAGVAVTVAPPQAEQAAEEEWDLGLG